MTVITTEQTIEKIIDNFDFDKVLKVMKHIDWMWNGEKNLPSVEQLKKAATEKLSYCCEVLKNSKEKKKRCFCRGGGFVVGASKNNDGAICLSLSFQIASFNWSTKDTPY